MAICCFAIYANYPAFTATTAGAGGSSSSNTKAKRSQRKSRYTNGSNNLARLARHGKVQVAHIAAVSLYTQYTLSLLIIPSLSLSCSFSLWLYKHIIIEAFNKFHIQLRTPYRCKVHDAASATIRAACRTDLAKSFVQHGADAWQHGQLDAEGVSERERLKQGQWQVQKDCPFVIVLRLRAVVLAIKQQQCDKFSIELKCK